MEPLVRPLAGRPDPGRGCHVWSAHILEPSLSDIDAVIQSGQSPAASQYRRHHRLDCSRRAIPYRRRRVMWDRTELQDEREAMGKTIFPSQFRKRAYRRLPL